jgi:hypothetical protein
MSTDDPLDRIDRAPTRASSVLALCAAVLTTGAGLYSPFALGICLLGGLALAAGLAAGAQRGVTAGSGMLVTGALAGGLVGAPVLPTLVGVTGGLLALDLGSTALTLGDQLGRAAETLRLELLHAAAGGLVGLGLVVAGLAVHETATGGQPLTAVLGLVVAVVLLSAALRRVSPVTE